MRQHLNNCKIHRQTNKQTNSHILSFVQNRLGQVQSAIGTGQDRGFKDLGIEGFIYLGI